MEFGRLSCLPQEAAWMIQNKEKGLTLDTLGGIKFILTSSPLPPSPHVATPAKVSTAPMEKIICNIEFFCIIICIILCLKNF